MTKKCTVPGSSNCSRSVACVPPSGFGGRLIVAASTGGVLSAVCTGTAVKLR